MKRLLLATVAAVGAMAALPAAAQFQKPEDAIKYRQSAFNIKTDSLTLENFTLRDVAALYQQHTDDTGQVFTPAATALVFELTQGQP